MLDIVAYLDFLPPDLRAEAVSLLAEPEGQAVDADWAGWAHRGQLEPPGDAWDVWVMMAGRGFGKTMAGANWVFQAVKDGPEDLRIALVGATVEEARSVMVDGRSGLRTVAEGWIRHWSATRGVLSFTTGAEARIFSGAAPEQLRGPEHHIAWCDELAKWRDGRATWDNLRLGLRLGVRPRALVTTTPRAGSALRDIMREPGCVVTGGRTADNPHTPAAYKAAVERLYRGTRTGAQELDGVLLPAGGALWTPEVIERCRGGDAPAGFARTLIGVDPPSGEGTCGIVACARDADGVGHVLADHSVTGRTPEGWASAVADAARAHGTRAVVAERNQGGRMVESVLKAADHGLDVRLVHAADGKAVRAQPIALLFEAGRVRLRARFPELEAELMGLVDGAPYQGPGGSPDRADAMVWALTELMLGGQGEPGVRRL